MKPKRFFQLIGLIMILVFNTGCGSLVYVPGAPVIPSHRQNGDTQLRAGWHPEGYLFSVTHAVDEHMYISADIYNVKGQIPDEGLSTSKTNQYKIFNWLVEGGYYHSANERLTYGIGLGAGASYVDSQTNIYRGVPVPMSFIGTLFKATLTPYISLTIHPVSIGMGHRLTYLSRTDGSRYPIELLAYEPYLEGRIGSKSIKIFAGVTAMTPLYDNVYKGFDYSFFSLAIGVEADLSRLLQSKGNKEYRELKD